MALTQYQSPSNVEDSRGKGQKFSTQTDEDTTGGCLWVFRNLPSNCTLAVE